MRITLVCAATLITTMALGASPFARAQDTSSHIIQRSVAQSHGLDRAWLTHIEIGGQDRVQEVVYWTPPPAPVQKAVKQQEPVEVLGKKEPMEVEDLLPKPPPPPAVVPIEQRPTLYALSRRGVLHAIDAETGGTIWTTQVGSREKPNEGPGVGKEYVAVVNGSDLHVIDRRDGGLAFRKALNSVPAAAPAVGDEWVYVPMLSGNITAYRLPDIRLGAGPPPPNAAALPPKAATGAKVRDTAERDRKLRDKQRVDYNAGQIEMMNYGGFGPATIAPLVTSGIPGRLVWATSRGQVYLAPNDRPQIDNRFDMLKPVEAPLMYWTPFIYATSLDGYVYGVHERKLDSPWRYSIGEPLREPAVCIDDEVYAIGPTTGMFCLDGKTGDRRWWAPGIRRFLAASASRLYVADNAGAMQILDRKKGAQVDSLRIDRLDLRPINQHSDRIYLGTSTGVLQCLHEVAQAKPLMHLPPPPVVKIEPKKEKEPEPEKPPPEKKEPAKPAPKPVEKKPVEKKPVEKKPVKAKKAN